MPVINEKNDVFKLIKPILINVYKVEEAIGIYEGIMKYPQRINDANHGWFFGIVRNMTLEIMTLSSCRIYDKSNPQYKKHTIPELIKIYKQNSFFLSTLKNQASIKKLQLFIDNIPSKDNDPCLTSLMEWRNKVIAHQENLDLTGHELKGFPSIADINELNKISFNFCKLFLEAHCPKQSLLESAHSTRTATLRLVAEVIDEDFKSNPEKIHDFFS